MNNTYYIEKTVLASVLNSELDCDLDKNYFIDEFHKKIVIGINRLKDIGEYVDFETLRSKFLEVHKWSYLEDDKLIDIMTSVTPFKTQKIFNIYYDKIKSSYINSSDRRFSI